MSLTKKHQGSDFPFRAQGERLRTVYQEWQRTQKQENAKANLTLFALDLGYGSHSQVGRMLTGAQRVSAEVVERCFDLWGISANWLMFGDGPMYAVEVVTADGLRDTLAEYLANRVRLALRAQLEQSAVQIAHDAARVTGPGQLTLLVDGAAALDSIGGLVEREVSARLEDLDHVWALGTLPIAQAQRAAVYGSTAGPVMLDDPTFERLHRDALARFQRRGDVVNVVARRPVLRPDVGVPDLNGPESL